MPKIELEFDNWLDDELAEYLYTIDGLTNIKIDKDNDIINLEYDENKISPNRILLEINAFFETLNFSQLVAFDKRQDSKYESYEIKLIYNCEFCLRGFIDDLFNTKGIISANCDFKRVIMMSNHPIIKITYDPDIISIKQIKEMENEFNK